MHVLLDKAVYLGLSWIASIILSLNYDYKLLKDLIVAFESDNQIKAYLSLIIKVKPTKSIKL